MSENQNFENEKIRLPDDFHALIQAYCSLSKELRSIMWPILVRSEDPTDLYNIFRVLQTIDVGVSREIEKDLKVSQGSDIPKQIIDDVIHRLKENGIWNSLKNVETNS
jgi:hypothetical protein